MSEYCKNCFELAEKLAKREQECEELKEEIQKLEMEFCNECGEKDDYNIPCRMIRNLNYDLVKEFEVNERYRKALKKIKKYCKDQNLKYDLTACEILTIIEEIKEKYD